MAYYADITFENSLGTSAGDSPANRWGWSEFKSFVNAVSATANVHVKGYHLMTENFSINVTVGSVYLNIGGWDGEAWMLDSSDQYSIGIHAINGTNYGSVSNLITNAPIINNDTPKKTIPLINSVILRDEGELIISAGYSESIDEGGTDFCGCTVKASTIDINHPSDKSTVEFENCFFTDNVVFGTSTTYSTLDLRNNSFEGTSSVNALSAGTAVPFANIINTNNIFNANTNATLPLSSNINSLTADGVQTLLSFSAFSADNTMSGSGVAWGTANVAIIPAAGETLYGHCYGFKGTPRRGVGAFYFNGPYYVDLDANVSTGLSATGELNNPMSYDQFVWLTRIYHGDEVWKFKGDISITSATSSAFKPTGFQEEFIDVSAANVGSYIFDSWDLSANGLWRVATSGDNGFGLFNKSAPITIKNAFITVSGNNVINLDFDPGSATPYLKIYNSQVRQLVVNSSAAKIINKSNDNDGNVEIYGSSIVVSGTNGEIVISNNKPTKIIDSILLFDTSTSAVSANGTSAESVETNLPSSVFFGMTSGSDLVFDSTALTIPFVESVDSYDKENYSYNNFNITVTGTNDWSDYSTGIGGYSRYGIGAFYFPSISLSGHIGSFYFGPINDSIETNVSVLELIAHSPTVVGEINASSTQNIPLFMLMKAHSPTVFTLDTMLVWFVGTPRKGTSPLCVDFEAFVKFHPVYEDKYKVVEYKWWFDFVNHSTEQDAVVSSCGGVASKTISHIYQGYAGQKYDVKLCVKVSPK